VVLEVQKVGDDEEEEDEIEEEEEEEEEASDQNWLKNTYSTKKSSNLDARDPRPGKAIGMEIF